MFKNVFRNWLRPRKTKTAFRWVKPQLEAFEDRATPAVVTWTGAVGSVWSDDGNWSGNQKPGIGDDLIFPANAQNKINFNDFGNGRNFGSITLQGSDYVLNGNRIDLRSEGEVIIAGNASGTNRINLAI